MNTTKKLLKILNIILVAIMLLSIFSNVYADAKPSDITIKDTTAFNSIGGKIIGGIQAVGNIVSIAILIVLGIKYMMGSAEEKAEYKKTLIPYIIGAVLVFAASTIAGMVFQFASSI